jgi:hypothetical protein
VVQKTVLGFLEPWQLFAEPRHTSLDPVIRLIGLITGLPQYRNGDMPLLISPRL